MNELYLKSLNKALREMLENDSDVIIIGEDIRDPYGGAFKVTKGLSKLFPERVLNTPISEPSLCGVVTGMSVLGMKPILEIMFGDFISLCFDQVLNHLSKFRWIYKNQIFPHPVIRTPMGGGKGYGPTHSQSLEKYFVGIPGIHIVVPSIYHNPGELLINAVEKDIKYPVLFIETKILYPEFLKKQEKFWQKIEQKNNIYPYIIFSNNEFKEADITFVTYGGMSNIVIEAANDLLLEYEITSEVIILSLLNPLNLASVVDSLKRTGFLITVEEGTKRMGIGAEIISNILEDHFKLVKKTPLRIAAKDFPISSCKYLEEEILPKKEDILKKVTKVLL